MDIPLKADTWTSEISEQNKLIFLSWRNNAKFVKNTKNVMKLEDKNFNEWYVDLDMHLICNIDFEIK